MDITLKEIMEIIVSFLLGSGISFHFTKKYCTKKTNKMVQKNSTFSKNNTQIGEINVRN